MGDIYRMICKDARDKDNKNESTLILKIAPSNLIRREKTGVRNSFVCEINMYNKVVHILE